jgi:hypothetical protein
MAHLHLPISALKAVSYKDILQCVSYLKKRFLIMCAMTSPGFQAGQYFWEVLIGHNKISYWECARISVDWKKQYANLNPINGYWITGQETESWYFVNNPNRFCLSLRDNPT